MNAITNKEWLDLAWKYFQQHAQQRISYFNFFVIFSTILTTGLVTTFQESFDMPYLGCAIGLIQVFLSIMFWKIDQRNKFLTKHAEEVIKSYESSVDDTSLNRLFINEEIKTSEQVSLDKEKFFIRRQITHGKSYKYIYLFFLLWGVAGIIISIGAAGRPDDNMTQRIDAAVYLKYDKIDSLNNAINRRDSITNLLFENIKSLSNDIDSLRIISKSYKSEIHK